MVALRRSSTQRRCDKIESDALRDVREVVEGVARKASAEGLLLSGAFLHRSNRATIETLRKHFREAAFIFRQLPWALGDDSEDLLQDLMNNIRDQVIRDIQGSAAGRSLGSQAIHAAQKELREALDSEIEGFILDYEQGIVRPQEFPPVTSITNNSVTITHSSISDSVLTITQSGMIGQDAKDIAAGLQKLLDMPEIKALDAQDGDDVGSAAKEALEELGKPSPDGGRVARCLRMVRSGAKAVLTGAASELLADMIEKAGALVVSGQ